jgi:hypothetical protein
MSVPGIFPKKWVYTCPNCGSDIEVPITSGLLPASQKCSKCEFVLFFPSQPQPQPNPIKEQEAQLSEFLETWTKWLSRAWKKSGTSGKFFILAMFVGMASPFIIGTFAIVIVWWWVVPIAITLTDRTIVFGVLFSLLTAIALKVGETARQILYGAYLTRRMRNPEKLLPS